MTARVTACVASSVPHFVVLRSGSKVAEYVGSKEAELEAVISGVL